MELLVKRSHPGRENVIRSLARSVLILLAVLGAATAVRAQSYPLPATTPGTSVSCDPALPAAAVAACPFAASPSTPGYQLPIKTFTGRFLDATWTPDYQCNFRTSRAGAITLAPDGKRLYVQMGSGVVAYDTSTFFTQKLGQPLTSINNLGSALGLFSGHTVRECGRFAENYLPWDRFSYFESRLSGFDVSNAMDGQDRLIGYDVDDRGNVYSAAFLYGWGIAHDDGGAGGQLMSFVSQKTLANNQGMAATSIFAIKTTSHPGTTGPGYYAVVGAQRTAQAIVWDVTDATNPVSVGIRNIPLPDSIARGAGGDRLAMVSPDNGELRIYTADGYVNGASPIFQATPPSGRSFGGVASDGSNFYTAETGPGLPIRFHTLAPQGLTYLDTATDTTEVFNSLRLSYNSGLLTVSGIAPGGFDIRVFRVISPTSFRNVDLSNYIRNYYFASPPGAPFIAASSLGKVLLSDAVTYKHANGKTYLILSAGSLGDVYELQTADGISASVKRFGETLNPNTPPTSSTTPVYGDKVVFSGTATAPTPFQVTWSFGNPETADNGNLSILSNVDITHQFGGLTAAGIAGPKLVTVTSLLDPTVTGTLPLQLRTPTARIGILTAGSSASSILVRPPAAVVSGDSFVDASDGAVEGHFSSWTLDDVVIQAVPTASTPVGVCGAHVMSMTAHYGPYVSTGSVLSTVPGPQGPVDFPVAGGSISYNAVPFLGSVGAPASSADGASVVFNGAFRTTVDPTAFVGTPAFTYQWDLMNAARTASLLSTAPAAAAGGVIAPFLVPNATVAANPGSSAQLTVSVVPAGLSTACAPFASNVATGSALNPPDPMVVATGCTATNIPCSLTATSIGGNESDWLPTGYTWVIDGGAAGNTKTITPTLAESIGVPHTITVTVRNSFTTATSAPITITTARPACTGVPTVGNISVVFSGETSNCPSAPSCTAGETIDFFVRGILIGGNGGAIYPFNDACDKYTWNWGDGSPASNLRNPVHTFVGGASSYNVSMTIDGGNGALTVPLTVNFAAAQPSCQAPDQFKIFATERGLSSGCSRGVACNQGETVNFDLAAQLVNFDFTCGNAQYTWTFDDNGATAQGKSVNHPFLTARTYDVTVQALNSLGSTTLHIPVIVTEGSTTGGSGSCSTNPNPINTIARYSQAPSGCTESNHANCVASSPITFDLQAVQYSLASCYTILWHFDDGSPDSTQQSPVHTFIGGKSSYAVTVTITGGPGGPVPFHLAVNFGSSVAEPIPTFSVSPASPIVDQVVTFTNTNPSTRATKWAWDFGDQRSIAGPDKSVTHTYTTLGSYFVTLTETDSAGATIGSKVQTVVVTEPSRRHSAHH
jgi:PKD repeat protein